jgi:hypothetical protein
MKCMDAGTNCTKSLAGAGRSDAKPLIINALSRGRTVAALSSEVDAYFEEIV